MDGEKVKGEVVMMDKDYKETLEREEHVPVPKSVYITREMLDEFGFTVRCTDACRFSGERRDRGTPRKVER